MILFQMSAHYKQVRGVSLRYESWHALKFLFFLLVIILIAYNLVRRFLRKKFDGKFLIERFNLRLFTSLFSVVWVSYVNRRVLLVTNTAYYAVSLSGVDLSGTHYFLENFRVLKVYFILFIWTY